MKNLKKFLIMLIIILAGCEHATKFNEEIPLRELTQAEKQIVSGTENFSFNIFKKIAQAEPDKNVFISPLSISMALGMTLNGADGDTYQAMKSTLSLLGLTQPEINESYQSLIELLTKIDEEVIMEIANSIWYRNTIQVKQAFIETNKKYFNAVVNAMNFDDPAAVEIINNWVKESTKGKIEKIVERINRETIMYLINAIYFKGTWKYQFDKNKTKDDFFTKRSGQQVPCKMMEQETQFSVSSNEVYSAIDLSYGKGNFSMTILLPDRSKSVQDVITTLTSENWNNLLKSFGKAKKNLMMPRFKLEYKKNLNQVLKDLGMSIAFDPDNANFKRLYEGPFNAFISNVEHKTFIDVNEEGTEAAAVTSVEIGITSIQDPLFRVDRPFVYIIREKNSGSILFIGKMEDPSLEK
jgi:serpin B